MNDFRRWTACIGAAGALALVAVAYPIEAFAQTREAAVQSSARTPGSQSAPDRTSRAVSPQLLAGNVISCTASAQIYKSGGGLVGYGSMSCTQPVPNITVTACLQQQIFLFIYGGDFDCASSSDENTTFDSAQALHFPPHGHGYRTHTTASFVPPAGYFCDPTIGCNAQAYSNTISY